MNVDPSNFDSMYPHLTPFEPSKLLLWEFEHWVVCIRGKQLTLCSAVILVKRPTPSLGDLTTAEAAELPTIAARFERVVRAVFQAEKFNYVAAMMKDPFVHFHVFPRYSSPRRFANVEWNDPYWPGMLTLGDVPRNDDLLIALRDAVTAYPAPRA